MMAQGVEQIYQLYDFVVFPVTIHLWPGGTYCLSFFIGFPSWSSLWSTRSNENLYEKRIWCMATSTELLFNEGMVSAQLNDSEAITIDASPRDISSQTRPGLNQMFITNLSTDSLEISLQIHLRQLIDLSRFIKNIPPQIDALSCLESLSLSGEESSKNALRTDLDVDVIETGRVNVQTCPISLQPIVTPVKGKDCRHIQGFDATSYLTLATFTGSWRCPICQLILLPEDLARI